MGFTIFLLLIGSFSLIEGTDYNTEVKEVLDDLLTAKEQGQAIVADEDEPNGMEQQEEPNGMEQQDDPDGAVQQDDGIGDEQEDPNAIEEDLSLPLGMGSQDAQEEYWSRRRRRQRRKRRRRRQQRVTTGVTYTRFGKSSCRAGTQLVYKGVVAGSYYYYRGGGSNYLCLPDHPEYSRYRSGVQGYSYLWGTEYEVPIKSGTHDHNVPCAVCYVPNRSTSLMIPAKINCPRSFTREFYGYLMSAHRSHYRTEFVCVDKAMDVVRGTRRNTNGALMYQVEVNCNSGIHCRPYIAQKEVTCVVCSR